MITPSVPPSIAGLIERKEAEIVRRNTAGAYSGQSREAIAATLGLLRHFRAFLASDCREMRDPFELAEWRDGASRLDKPAAARKLGWLVNMAISRKGGRCLPINDSAAGGVLNHRGKPARKWSADYQRGLMQDAYEVNRPRLVIRGLRTPELQRRFAERIAAGREIY